MKTKTARWNIRRAAERGQANHGWLQSQHTFSFADYYDPAHLGFRSLRVINEDRVAPGRGFGTHPHRDMEIFSYVLSGGLEHRDSMGNGSVLRPGQIQLMSAGTGVAHSEFNPSPTEPAHFLQVWIHPEKPGLKPSYTEWHPNAAHDSSPKVLLISPDGAEGSALIHQDARVYRVRPGAGQPVSQEIASGRAAWIQVTRGALEVDGLRLEAGDAASTEEAGSLQLTAAAGLRDGEVEALLFDLK
jgi:redox-sensitive bicupin YhaK (pirin superfamily)